MIKMQGKDYKSRDFSRSIAVVTNCFLSRASSTKVEKKIKKEKKRKVYF
jgi:hypothetical protein